MTEPTTGRADYADRLNAKRDRLETAAMNAQNRADAGYRRQKAILDNIPMGQPILVGHHSERRHRRDLERADRGMRTYIEESAKADYLADRAAHLGDRAAHLGDAGISQDDPDALAKLRDRLAELESRHAMMKRTNAIIRKHRANIPAAAAALAVEFGTRESAMLEFLKPDVLGDIGFPPYAITNSNGNIRRIKDRIATLEQQAAVNANGGMGTIETDHYRVEDDIAENRIVLTLHDRVDRDVFTWIRSKGWRWARSHGAFLAYRNKWDHLGYFLPELERRAGWADA